MRGRLHCVLGLTSFAAGAVDASSFSKLGGVLASAMTGNLALLGLYLGRGSAASSVSAAVALSGFVLGAGAGSWVARGREQATALRLLLTAELAILALAAALWVATGQPHGGLSGHGVICCLAMGMGLQIIAGRQLNLAGIPTVVFTSTLANLISGVTHAVTRRTSRMPPDVLRQAAALVLYFCGALAAGICAHAGSPFMLALPATAAGLALALLLLPGG